MANIDRRHRRLVLAHLRADGARLGLVATLMTLDTFLYAIGIVLIVATIVFFVVLAVAIAQNAIQNGGPGD